MGTAARTILLVEDNPADAEIARRALRDGGSRADLVVVRDGREALDYLVRRRPDLVLLDLNLPGLPGLEVLRRLRADPALHGVPVVVLTTSRRPEDVRQTYAAGANTYIEKPQDFNRFVQVLRTIEHYWLDTALLPPPESHG